MNSLTRLAAFALAAGLAATPALAEDYPELELKFASYVSADLPQSKADIWWADQIHERSGGKITIQFFWSQTLGKSTELLQLVASGAVDFASPSIGYYASNFPLSNVHQLPMVLPDNRIAQIVATEVAELPAVKAEYEAAGVVPLLWHSLPTYRVLCNTAIDEVGDFKGLKIRSFGKYVPMMWDQLGATGVNVLAPEMYEGLQRGNVDCTYISPDFAHAYKLEEVAKYFNDANFGAISAWTTFVNAEEWKAWPESVRSLILEVSAEAAVREREAVYQAAADAQAAMLASGMTEVAFADPDALKAAVPDFLEVWVGQMEQQGLGDQARAVADLVRERVAKASAAN